ncbi:hypothetical protein [Pseudalkalibacillus decolorationis]|uniref:hypothetical protein n=1 Tax=Pseudalkalibacillus decolorationis TaxID=163879 RepID=UPI0027E274E0|nr:hypothetical protein [Pseudalkalibacillus decolorationis]
MENKAYEELEEIRTSKTNEETLEELADLLEVLFAMTIANGFTKEELEEKRKQKTLQRGGFTERIFLMDVFDEREKADQ